MLAVNLRYWADGRLPFEGALLLCVMSDLLRGVDEICAVLDVMLLRLVLTDVSGQPVNTIFNGQARQDEGFLLDFLDHRI